MNNTLELKGYQSDTVWHRPDLNRMHLAEEFASWNDDFDVLILPEMFTSGFTMKPDSIPEEQDQLTIEWMVQWAERFDALLIGSIIFREEDRSYNRLYAVSGEGYVGTYDKRHLFTYAQEHECYSAGKDRLIIPYQDWKICPLVCYDLRFPVWSRNDVDYDLLIYVANWPDSRALAWNTLLPARAVENQAYVAGINRSGMDGNDIWYRGDSAIYDYAGRELTSLSHQEGSIRATLDKQALQSFRERYAFLRDRDTFTLDIIE